MSAERERNVAVWALLAVAVAYWLPAFFHPLATGFGDWQMIHHNWEVGYVALTRYGEWPLWDPFHCGGITMWGNPEAQHLSPFFFLSLLTGTTLATKVMVVAHTWAGLVGMYFLARRHFGSSPRAAAFAALAWGCSGFFCWQIGGGHATFITFYLAPWVLLAWRAAVRDWRMSAALAVVMALVAWEGGTYPFPYFVLLLVFDALVLLAQRRGVGRIAVAAFLSGALTMLLSAVRWVPSLITLSRVPRNANVPDVVPPWQIPEMLARPNFPWRDASHQFVVPEYSAYMGVAATIVGLAGIYAAVRKRRYEPLLGLLFFGVLMSGQFASWAPWTLVHHLPIYRSLRVPSRFSVLFTFYFALLGAIAIDTWLPRILAAGRVRRLTASRPRLSRALPWLVVAALVIDPISYGIAHAMYWWPDPPIDTSHTAKHFHLVPKGNYGKIYASLPRRNLGTPGCYVGNLNWPISHALWVGKRPQARVPGGAGRVLGTGRTVNRAWAEVDMSRPGRVVFDQNYDRDWHTDVGHVVEDKRRLAVDVPAGRRRITVSYHPPMLRPSLWMTALGALLCLLIALTAVAKDFRLFKSRSRMSAP